MSVEQPNKVCEVQQGQTEVVIEPATEEDLDAIVRIEEASFSAPWTRKMVQAELTGNPFATFLVSRRKPSGEILGYVCYWILFEELRVMTLAVAPTARRQGVATALVRYALQDGQEHGVTRALLEVRISNEEAMRLYAKFGFHHVAVRAQYYHNPTEDAVIMELDPLEVRGQD